MRKDKDNESSRQLLIAGHQNTYRRNGSQSEESKMVRAKSESRCSEELQRI